VYRRAGDREKSERALVRFQELRAEKEKKAPEPAQ
jgi:hypothetical protein